MQRVTVYAQQWREDDVVTTQGNWQVKGQSSSKIINTMLSYRWKVKRKALNFGKLLVPPPLSYFIEQNMLDCEIRAQDRTETRACPEIELFYQYVDFSFSHCSSECRCKDRTKMMRPQKTGESPGMR